ncbi:MAG TPA: hypothetical protein DD400_02825 [Rhodospirillaceae bacterium]|nr:hypothetical protein [Rhodospirillaceae bacterium]
MLCSVVITSFRRPHLITRSVRSALAFCAALQDGEVVVVDDGSFDDSLYILQRDFSLDIERGRLRLLAHLKNQGVTAAKNTGFMASRGAWVCFLDSDDELLPEKATALPEAIKEFPEVPILCFRCVKPDGSLVGQSYHDPIIWDPARYFKNANYGEVLTLIRRDIDFQMPYDDDLRGFEGLGCLRIMKRHGAGVILPLPLRRYYTDHEGRLSSKKAFLLRGFRLARGHWRTLKEFWPDLSVQIKASLALKVFCYFLLGCGGVFTRFRKKQDDPVIH